MINNKHNLLKKLSGIALIEILITLLIILGGLTAVAVFGANLMRDSSLVKQEIQAMNLAKSKLEYFRSYETLSSGVGKLAYADIITGSDTPASQTGDNTTFSRTWTVTDFPNGGAPSAPTYKVVNVQVTWTDVTGTARAVELVTIINQEDPVSPGDVIG